MLVPGLNLESSRAALGLAAQFSSVYAAVGVHPTESEAFDTSTLRLLRELARAPKVVAIGEIGLDYYWVADPAEQAHQRDLLRAQLALAAELSKPVILHCRERDDASRGPCIDDLLSVLREWRLASRATGAPLPGVLHSYSGSLDDAQQAIDLGFLIGVTGPVTYKNADNRRQVCGGLPLNSLLIETDAPYLAPQPHRGKRNEPAFVAHIADKIAEIHSQSAEEIAVVTGANANRLFSWGDTA